VKTSASVFTIRSCGFVWRALVGNSCGVSCGDFLEISGFLGKCAQEEQGSFIWEAARDLFIAGHAYLYTIYI